MPEEAERKRALLNSAEYSRRKTQVYSSLYRLGLPAAMLAHGTSLSANVILALVASGILIAGLLQPVEQGVCVRVSRPSQHDLLPMLYAAGTAY